MKRIHAQRAEGASTAPHRDARRLASDRTRETIDGKILALLRSPFDDLTDAALQSSQIAFSMTARP